jgi:hypothetical protein
LVELIGVGLFVLGGIIMLLMLFMPIDFCGGSGSSNSFRLMSWVLPHSNFMLLSSELDASIKKRLEILKFEKFDIFFCISFRN